MTEVTNTHVFQREIDNAGTIELHHLEVTTNHQDEIISSYLRCYRKAKDFMENEYWEQINMDFEEDLDFVTAWLYSILKEQGE